MTLADSCTAVLINYQTPDITVRAIQGLQQHYPGLHLLIIDNGSQDTSRSVLERFSSETNGFIRALFNSSNIHHGPAMNMAAHAITSPYIFFLDSDCEIRRGGFLEHMIERIEESANNYAIGKLTYMDRRGFDISECPEAIRYVRPICMVLRRKYYVTLPPFQHHGAPCLKNMKEAAKQGLGLLDFPVEDYVYHLGRGTAGRYGYHLGWKGKLNHLLHKIGL